MPVLAVTYLVYQIAGVQTEAGMYTLHIVVHVHPHSSLNLFSAGNVRQGSQFVQTYNNNTLKNL